MNSKLNHDLEKTFCQRDTRLLDFYDEESNNIPSEEEESLLPILNSLDEREERYKELDLVAEGGEKRITRVYDHRLDRQVAMARAVCAKTAQDQEQFLREARLEANLAHPNITPVHNMGFDADGVPFFTMELIPGDSLKEIIAKLRSGDEAYKNKYPLENLLGLYLKVCDAIAYAHSRNVLHLDIKPDNIRVGDFGEVFICDWGLAQIVFNEKSSNLETPGELDGDVLNDMTLTGTIKGSPGFMAPEQTVTGGIKSFKTDIYALGALLYTLLAFEPPVSGNSQNELLENTREGRIIPLRSRKTGFPIPRSLEAVVMKALAHNPANRYSSVAELQQEIRRYLTGFPTQAEHLGPMRSLSLLVRRHNQLASVALFFLLLMAVIVSANLIVIQKQKNEAVVARNLAEKNFQLYREQQEATSKLDTQLSVSTDYTLHSSDFSRAREMIRALEIGLDKATNPEEKKALLVKKGNLHFVLQQFNQAIECLEVVDNKTPSDQDNLQLSKKYVQLKPIDRRVLTFQQVADLVEEALASNKTIYYLYYHHMQRKPDPNPEAYLPLAKAMLDKLNRTKADVSSPHPLKLEKHNLGYHLDLSESPYLIYTLSGVGLQRINILEPFNLYSMDIHNLPLRNLAEFNQLHIKELDMAGVHIPRTRILVRNLTNMGIIKLRIDVEAYSPKTIKDLRTQHEVLDSAHTPPLFQQPKNHPIKSS
jgi:serine/threonine protein kinase